MQLQPSENQFGDASNPNKGKWIAESHGLVLYVRQQLLAATDAVFTFELRNPSLEQASPQISIKTTVFIVGPQVVLNVIALSICFC